MELTDSSSAQPVCVFCFTPNNRLAAITGKNTMESEPQLSVCRGFGIAAVIGPVSHEDVHVLSNDVATQDLAWMGPRVCRHEAVIERVMRHAPVFPARFGTIFSSVQSLKQFLGKHHAVIARFLARMNAKEEWGIKIWLNRPKAVETISAAMLDAQEASSGPLSQGARYLARQRIHANAGQQLSCCMKETYAKIVNDLSLEAVDFRRRRLVGGQSGQGGLEVVLNLAFLVPRKGATEFCARVESVSAGCATRGLTIESSGPWPPYSFCPPLTDAS
ncbi:MAG: GvpL/GvpF family gas vesicle protein [Verrucomicrobia bacterium]|nr:GvpL/GvpF family gas vesicle protein [Verrucomicrobiota bacterium]